MAVLDQYYRSRYESVAQAAAGSQGIPSAIFTALIGKESSWNPYATGADGEIGLTQLMPGTASDLNVNAWNIDENIMGGARYLSTQYKTFGNWKDALAAYNAGPGNYQLPAAQEYAGDILAKSGYTTEKSTLDTINDWIAERLGLPKAPPTGIVETAEKNLGEIAKLPETIVQDTLAAVASQIPIIGLMLGAAALVVFGIFSFTRSA